MICKPAGIGTWMRTVDVGQPDLKCRRYFAPLVSEFAATLATKHFTNGKSDCDTVTELYRQTVEALIVGATGFELRGLDWKDDDMRAMCNWLPTCTELTTLDIAMNPGFSDDGWAMLAKLLDEGAMPKLRSLPTICLHSRSPATNEGRAVFSAAMERRGIAS